MSRKKREQTSPTKVQKYAEAATESKNAQEAAVRCGFADTPSGASSWESTYSTMRRNMVSKLVEQGASQEAAEALAYKKMPACAWGGTVQKSVEDTFGISAEELEELGIATAKPKNGNGNKRRTA